MERTHRNLKLWLPLGAGFGVGLGLAIGSAMQSRSLVWIIVGAVVGLAVGYIIGSRMDNETNAQLEEKGYQVKSVCYNADNGTYKMVIVDKQGHEYKASLPEKKVQKERYAPGDYVFMNKSGGITQAFGKKRAEDDDDDVDYEDDED